MNNELYPYVIWITGMSASGKTTLAEIVTKQLINLNYPVVMLDGDELREILDVELLHSEDDRKQLALKYAKLVCTISKQGVIVVIATVALFKEVHEWNRKNIPGYFEVFLDVPVEQLRKRDPKGLYKKYDSGEIHNIAGLDIKVDFPVNPHLHLTYNRNHILPPCGWHKR